MTTAKLNVQHDYITLKVVFDDNVSVNLTQSRRGIKASGKGVTNGQLRSLLKGFDAYGKEEKLSYGPKMQGLRALATQCLTVDAFIEKLGGPKADDEYKKVMARIRSELGVAVEGAMQQAFDEWRRAGLTDAQCLQRARKVMGLSS